jgi:hypothetical protein
MRESAFKFELSWCREEICRQPIAIFPLAPMKFGLLCPRQHGVRPAQRFSSGCRSWAK